MRQKNLNKAQLSGSQTAKKGFENENKISNKFNDWKQDKEAQEWLVVMGYELKKIENVKAVVVKIIPKPKSDIQVQITIKLKEAINKTENISLKLVSNPKGYNQIDKRKVDKYIKLWEIPPDVAKLLKLFTGETLPNIPNPRDKRRMFLFEFDENDQRKILNFFETNKSLIVKNILQGSGEYAVGWILVTQKVENGFRYILKSINEVIKYYSGEVKISKKGSILIGKITIQRKGGKPDPTSLQFKMNPSKLFDLKR